MSKTTASIPNHDTLEGGREGIRPAVDIPAAVIDQQTQMILTSTQLLTHPGNDDSYYQRLQAAIDWATAGRDVVLQNRLVFERALAR